MSSKPKQRCPTCGREFERLWQHKCAAAVPDSTKISRVQHGPAENSSSVNAKERQTCHGCGRDFERLWQHKCPAAVAGSSEEARIHDTRTEHSADKRGSPASVSSRERQTCPGCGRDFERLGQHKCPAITQDSTKDSRHKPVENTASINGKEKQTCPGCGRDFERLWQHKCPAVTQDSTKDSRHQHKPVENTASINGKEKQTCPGCGRDFERLWQHKCPAAYVDPDERSVTMSGHGDRNVVSGKLTCGRLSDGPHRTERHPGPDHRGARSKVTSAQSSGGCPSSEQVCPWCGSTFKRLYQHKCKAVSMPATSPQPPSARPDSSQPPGNQPVIDTNALEQQAERVFNVLCLQPSSDPNSEAIAFFDDEVKVQREEKDKVLYASGRFRDEVTEWLEGCTKDVTWDSLNAGSSYDGTKVARADEVDYMFFPHLPGGWLRISCDNAPPGFCFVEMTSAVPRDDPRASFLQSVCDDRQKQKLSSQLFRQTVFHMMRQAVADKRRAKEDPQAKSGGASFPVLLDAFPRSGKDGQQGLRPVSIDLVPALKLDGFPSVAHSSLRRLPPQDMENIQKAGFHVVPKDCPHARYGSVKHLLWRFSFSLAEKLLTNFADRRLPVDTDPAQESPPTCRKQVLRILKRILELFKGVDNSRTTNPKMRQLRKVVDYLKKEGGFRDFEVEKFSTFQIRTLLWTEFYVTYPGFTHWTTQRRRTRLIHCLRQLKKMVSGRMCVSHFFLPGLDIMAEVPKREREYLYILFYIAKELF